MLADLDHFFVDKPSKLLEEVFHARAVLPHTEHIALISQIQWLTYCKA